MLKMASEQESHWQAFHESPDKDLTEKWESLSIAPYQENGNWTSVFLMKETAGKLTLWSQAPLD
jgi:hypothetical protein